MNIDEAKEYLKSISKPEFFSYINTKIAGDFAVSIALKMSGMEAALNECNKTANEWEGGLARKISLISAAPLTANRIMILCKQCGNNRCHHATDEVLDCTGSNEPGQAGSRYA